MVSKCIFMYVPHVDGLRTTNIRWDLRLPQALAKGEWTDKSQPLVS